MIFSLEPFYFVSNIYVRYILCIAYRLYVYNVVNIHSAPKETHPIFSL